MTEKKDHPSGKALESLQRELSRMPEYVDAFLAAASSVVQFFPDAQIFLGIFYDPDIGGAYPCVYIKPPQDSPDFYERLQKAEASFENRLFQDEEAGYA